MTITCGGCDTTWTGLAVAHCGACHETFGSVHLFDKHRDQRGPRGRCLDPGSIKHVKGIRKGKPILKLDKRGVWVGAQPRPEELNGKDADGYGTKAA